MLHAPSGHHWGDRRTRANARIDARLRQPVRTQAGFSLVELLTVMTVVGIISAVAIPAYQSYHENCCIMAAVAEISGMIKEARQKALCDGTHYGVSFDPASGRVRLLSGSGPDGNWNTGDDQVVRSFSLSDKGGGLRFGHDSYGPLPSLAAAPDGISFPNSNTLICNPELTGTAGVAYLISKNGAAMAIKANSRDFGYTLWKWHGTAWRGL